MMKRVLVLAVGCTMLVGCGTAPSLSIQTGLESQNNVESLATDSKAEAFLRTAMDAAYACRRDPAATAFKQAALASETPRMALKVANQALQMKYFDREAQVALDRAVTLKADWKDVLEFAQNAAWYSRRELASNGFRRAADRCEKAEEALKVAEVAQGLRFYSRDAQYAMDKAATLP